MPESCRIPPHEGTEFSWCSAIAARNLLSGGSTARAHRPLQDDHRGSAAPTITATTVERASEDAKSTIAVAPRSEEQEAHVTDEDVPDAHLPGHVDQEAACRT